MRLHSASVNCWASTCEIIDICYELTNLAALCSAAWRKKREKTQKTVLPEEAKKGKITAEKKIRQVDRFVLFCLLNFNFCTCLNVLPFFKNCLYNFLLSKRPSMEGSNQNYDSFLQEIEGVDDYWGSTFRWVHNYHWNNENFKTIREFKLCFYFPEQFTNVKIMLNSWNI